MHRGRHHPLVFLHGFLGNPADFSTLPLRKNSPERYAPDLLALLPAANHESDVTSHHTTNPWFHDWLTAIAANIVAHWGTSVRPVLIGYSLGGRIAMNLVAQHSAAYTAAIFISANPGISEASERQLRVQQDMYWATRWETEPFDVVLNAWNALPIFAGTPDKRPNLSPCQRDQWAQVLRFASPGHTPCLWSTIPQWTLPTLWMVGKQDPKYVAMYSQLKTKVAQIEGAAHRVPWDAPEVFSDHCEHFLRSLPRHRSPT